MHGNHRGGWKASGLRGTRPNQLTGTDELNMDIASQWATRIRMITKKISGVYGGALSLTAIRICYSDEWAESKRRLGRDGRGFVVMYAYVTFRLQDLRGPVELEDLSLPALLVKNRLTWSEISRWTSTSLSPLDLVIQVFDSGLLHSRHPDSPFPSRALMVCRRNQGGRGRRSVQFFSLHCRPRSVVSKVGVWAHERRQRSESHQPRPCQFRRPYGLLSNRRPQTRILSR